jgi:hypothetical protein
LLPATLCCRPVRATPLRTSPAGGSFGSTTSRSKPPYDRSALRPEADTLNQTVRSRCTPPERDSFKPDPLRASSNSLNYRASNIRTKMAVVRLFRRKGAERDEKRPEVGLSRGPGGSDNLPGMAAFCGFPLIRSGKRMSRLARLAEGQELSSNPLRFLFKGLRSTLFVVDVD